MRSILLTFTAVLVFALPGRAQIDDKVADRLYESAKVLDELVQAPDGGVPKDLLQKAECVAVIPAVKKGAFIIGGNYGRGVVACKKDEGKGPWGSPAMISISGGSVGFQWGGQSNDVVMLFMTPDSIKHLLKDKVTLGGDASAAVGPKGREASAQTNATMRAEILTYARSRGVFAGISLKGAVLRPDNDANKALYNGDVDAKALLVEGKGTIPEPAKKFIDTLTKFTTGSN
jgi:lipid-binding SYLF domain-containing protein